MKILSCLLFLCAIAPAQVVNYARTLSGVNYQSGASYIIQPIDNTRVTQFNNAGAVAVTLAAGSTLGFQAGTVFAVQNVGAGTVTITCSGCTINGSATLVLSVNQTADMYSDGLNYVANRGGAAGGAGGANTQIQFNNAGNFSGISNVAAGSFLASNGASSLPIFQTKATIDIRDTAGIDCTGALDSSAALNTLFTNISNTKVIFPINCNIRAVSQITIFGQSNFVIESQGERPNTGVVGPSLFGCASSGTPGAVLYINRSGWFRITGIGIYQHGTGASGCSGSTFARSVDVDNSGGGGTTTTQGYFDHDAFTTNPQGGAVANYIGIQVLPTGANEEHFIFRDNYIHCQNSTNSFGIRVNNGTSDNMLAEGNTVAACFQAFRLDAGNLRIVQNHTSGNGTFSVFGANGATIFVGSCSSGPLYIAYNETSGDGPFINSNNDANGGCTTGMNIIGNEIGDADQSSTAYPVNIGTGGGVFNVIGNQFFVFPAVNQYMVGSNSQGASAGPTGFLNDIGNKYGPGASGGLGFSNPNYVFQGGEHHDGAISGIVGANGAGSASLSTNSVILQAPFTNNTLASTSPYFIFRSKAGGGPPADDWTIGSISNGTNSGLIFNHSAGPAANAFLSLDGTMSTIKTAVVATPTISSVQNIGGTGATSDTYAIVAFVNGTNTAGSSTVNTATAVATLSTTQFNRINFNWVPGSTSMCVWRTVAGGTPSTTGKIGCVSAVSSNTNNGVSNGGSLNVFFLDDKGLAGDSSSVPGTNTTGTGTFAGQIISSLSTGTAPFSVASTTPVSTLTVSNHPTLDDCGTTSTCSATQKTAALIVRGSVAFPTAATVTVTALPFTSSTSYSCTAGDVTTAAGVINATTYTSGSSVTFTETGGVNTDTMRYICVGF